jgi:hypothetical protein
MLISLDESSAGPAYAGVPDGTANSAPAVVAAEIIAAAHAEQSTAAAAEADDFLTDGCC